MVNDYRNSLVHGDFMKHRPGPWYFDVDRKEVISETGIEICSFDYGVLAPTEKANAQLISAAPELLKCMELSRELIASLKPLFLLIEPLSTMKIDSILNSIDEVLKKAKGEI